MMMRRDQEIPFPRTSGSLKLGSGVGVWRGQGRVTAGGEEWDRRQTRLEKEVRATGCHSPLKQPEKGGLKKQSLSWWTQEDEALKSIAHYFNHTFKWKGLGKQQEGSG